MPEVVAHRLSQLDNTLLAPGSGASDIPQQRAEQLAHYAGKAD